MHFWSWVGSTGAGVVVQRGKISKCDTSQVTVPSETRPLPMHNTSQKGKYRAWLQTNCKHDTFTQCIVLDLNVLCLIPMYCVL
jgi:hypothetical protein